MAFRLSLLKDNNLLFSISEQIALIHEIRAFTLQFII